MKNIIVIFSLIALVASTTIDLPYTVRDFTPSHRDFESYGGSGAVTGLVLNTLDVDGKPMLSASHPVIYSDASFNQWYRDTAGVNMAFTKTLTLTEDPTRPGIFTYSSSAFFPIDGEGFGDYALGHNFHFTSEIRTTFQYVGGEQFSFRGDDDVWVFVNGRLAVDLGGPHPPVSGSLNLDASASALNIAVGGTYELVIFQAERHTDGSNFNMETSIQFVPDTTTPIPTPGRPAYICEVMFPDFCAGTPQPAPGSEIPTRQATSCPSDPAFHFGGQAYSMEHYNAISFGNFYAASGDVEGRAAIRGNLDVTAYSFGYQTRSGGPAATDASLPYVVVVGGNVVNWVGGSIHPDGSGIPYAGNKEYIFVGGSFSGDSYLQQDVTGGPCNGCLDADWNNALAYYRALSTAWNGVADSATVVAQYSGLTLSCANPSASAYNVHIDAAVFSAKTWWNTVGSNCNPDAQITITITGNSEVKFAGASLDYFRSQRILYNVVATGNVRVEVGVPGNLLAPNNNYVQPGGVFIGQVIVANVEQALQINLIPCVRPAPPPTPTEEVCPEWETTCSGLDFPMANEMHSFRDFHVISFGSYVANTGDVEGRLAVRNDVSLGAGYTIGFELRTAGNQPDNSLPYSLVAGGDMCWLSGSLHPDGTGRPYAGDNEDAFVGGQVCGTTANYLVDEVVNSCGATEGCLTTYFDSAKSCYEGYQSTLAALSDNVAQSVEWSALKLTCSDSTATRYVVSIDAGIMSTYTYYTTDNCNFQASWVINVRGNGQVNFRGDSFPGVAGGIVYNIIGSGRVISVTESAVVGHILAPNNVLHQTGGVIIGKVVAGDITFALQINKVSCPDPVDVTITVPTTSDAPALAGSLDVASLSLQTGDSVRINGRTYSITSATNTKKIYITPSLASALPAGSQVSTTVSGASGRAPGADEESNTSSIVSVSVALLVAMLALF